MEISFDKILNNKLINIFEKLELNTKFAIVKNSDRPDLSDFQCNGALGLAKEEKKNPREIASIIAAELEKDSIIEKISIDGPGFINISIKNHSISDVLDFMTKDEKRFGVATLAKKSKVILDFGGPNVAKVMHVGHLRSGVIGESVQRIERFMGNEVISDVHLGDWGTPMGMIISEIVEEKIEPFSLNVQEITELYKKATIRCKDNEQAREKARVITAKMQDGDEYYRKVWQHLRDVSVEDVRQNYEKLDVNFDLWWGESDAHDASYEITKIAKEKGISEVDDGALIIRLEESNKPKPPVILEKSDGGFTYHTTDIATILRRVNELDADEVIYFTDQRQSFHFEQVFEATNKLGIAPDLKMKHIGFGTVNGKDGKPFKTRDGGVMTLENLIEMSKEKVRESMPKENDEYSKEYIESLVDKIAIAAIKFQDLKNNISSGYVFEIDDFAKFEGKTGPYIQYAIARINSILRRAKEEGLKEGNILISNEEERKLALKIVQLEDVLFKAYEEKEPSIISEYTYSLSQYFSSFYNSSSILNEENKDIATSRLSLAKLTRNILIVLLDLLGIQAPEVMLKA